MTPTSLTTAPGAKSPAASGAANAVGSFPPGSSAASPPDEELIELLRDGSPAAGEVLVKRYYQPLMRYLLRISGGEHLAEELHQQTWLSVLDHLDKFDKQSAGGGFKAWLFRIATNKANDYW